MTSIHAITVAAAVAYTCGVIEAWNGSLTSVMPEIPVSVKVSDGVLSALHAGVKRTSAVSVNAESASMWRTPPLGSVKALQAYQS